VKRLLATLDPVDGAVLAFVLYPAALEGKVPVGAEGRAALAKAARPILDVEAEITWQERLVESGTPHPELDACSRVLADLRGKRKERARQLFYHLIAEEKPISDPEALERSLNRCVLRVAKYLRKAS
jgi:hypothetical protein